MLRCSQLQPECTCMVSSCVACALAPHASHTSAHHCMPAATTATVAQCCTGLLLQLWFPCTTAAVVRLCKLCVLQVPRAAKQCDTRSIAAAPSVVRVPQHITQAHPLFAGFPGSASALSAAKHTCSKGNDRDRRRVLVQQRKSRHVKQCLQDMPG
jgi:hypothetical protein